MRCLPEKNNHKLRIDDSNSSPRLIKQHKEALEALSTTDFAGSLMCFGVALVKYVLASQKAFGNSIYSILLLN